MKKNYARSVLYTIIATSALGVLFIIAPISYIGAYYYYVPHSSTVVPVHFDFSGKYGAVEVLAVDQETIPVRDSVDYKVELTMTLPRTRYNSGLGNFMARTSLLDTDPQPQIDQPPVVRKTDWPIGVIPNESKSKNSTRRPFILPHRSLLTQTVDDVVAYPLYFIGWRRELDHEYVSEQVLRQWNSKDAGGKFLAVELDRVVNVARAELVFTVKWTGLRYLMHQYRIIMFMIGTLFFWSVESAVMGVVAVVVVKMFSAKQNLKQLDSQVVRSDDYVSDHDDDDDEGEEEKKQREQHQRVWEFKKRMLELPDRSAQRSQSISSIPEDSPKEGQGEDEVEIHDPSFLLSPRRHHQEPTPMPEDPDDPDDSNATTIPTTLFSGRSNAVTTGSSISTPDPDPDPDFESCTETTDKDSDS